MGGAWAELEHVAYAISLPFNHAELCFLHVYYIRAPLFKMPPIATLQMCSLLPISWHTNALCHLRWG